jgi:hypothetical protein
LGFDCCVAVKDDINDMTVLITTIIMVITGKVIMMFIESCSSSAESLIIIGFIRTVHCLRGVELFMRS